MFTPPLFLSASPTAAAKGKKKLVASGKVDISALDFSDKSGAKMGPISGLVKPQGGAKIKDAFKDDDGGDDEDDDAAPEDNKKGAMSGLFSFFQTVTGSKVGQGV
jgi:hypothetical protein